MSWIKKCLQNQMHKFGIDRYYVYSNHHKYDLKKQWSTQATFINLTKEKTENTTTNTIYRHKFVKFNQSYK